MWSTGQLLFIEPWSTGHLSSDIVVAGKVTALNYSRNLIGWGISSFFLLCYHSITSTHRLPSTQRALFPPLQLGQVVSRVDSYPYPSRW